MRGRFGNGIFAAGGEANAARNLGVPVAHARSLFVMTALAAGRFTAIQALVTGSADTLVDLEQELAKSARNGTA
ncbi:hypothetical protein [Mesorhizobium carmichaelinearum]|uniref:hypothetical protein n=1 Tax=Mesorhizobium carmichaelinearum TaxID=1208188 RepID=UPI000BA3A419